MTKRAAFICIHRYLKEGFNSKGYRLANNEYRYSFLGGLQRISFPFTNLSPLKCSFSLLFGLRMECVTRIVTQFGTQEDDSCCLTLRLKYFCQEIDEDFEFNSESDSQNHCQRLIPVLRDNVLPKFQNITTLKQVEQYHDFRGFSFATLASAWLLNYSDLDNLIERFKKYSPNSVPLIDYLTERFPRHP